MNESERASKPRKKDTQPSPPPPTTQKKNISSAFKTLLFASDDKTKKEDTRNSKRFKRNSISPSKKASAELGEKTRIPIGYANVEPSPVPTQRGEKKKESRPAQPPQQRKEEDPPSPPASDDSERAFPAEVLECLVKNQVKDLVNAFELGLMEYAKEAKKDVREFTRSDWEALAQKNDSLRTALIASVKKKLATRAAASADDKAERSDAAPAKPEATAADDRETKATPDDTPRSPHKERRKKKKGGSQIGSRTITASTKDSPMWTSDGQIEVSKVIEKHKKKKSDGDAADAPSPSSHKKAKGHARSASWGNNKQGQAIVSGRNNKDAANNKQKKDKKSKAKSSAKSAASSSEDEKSPAPIRRKGSAIKRKPKVNKSADAHLEQAADDAGEGGASSKPDGPIFRTKSAEESSRHSKKLSKENLAVAADETESSSSSSLSSSLSASNDAEEEKDANADENDERLRRERSKLLMRQNSLKIDEMLARRPPYEKMVESGILKVWGRVDSDAEESARGRRVTAMREIFEAKERAERQAAEADRQSMESRQLRRSGRSATISVTPLSSSSSTNGGLSASGEISVRSNASADKARAKREANLSRRSLDLHSPPPNIFVTCTPDGKAPLVVPAPASPSDPLWYVERGGAGDFVPGTYFALEDSHQHMAPYRTFFYPNDHLNFWGMDEKLGPVVISLEQKESESNKRLSTGYSKFLHPLKSLGGLSSSMSKDEPSNSANTSAAMNNNSDNASSPTHSPPHSPVTPKRTRRRSLGFGGDSAVVKKEAQSNNSQSDSDSNTHPENNSNNNKETSKTSESDPISDQAPVSTPEGKIRFALAQEQQEQSAVPSQQQQQEQQEQQEQQQQSLKEGEEERQALPSSPTEVDGNEDNDRAEPATDAEGGSGSSPSISPSQSPRHKKSAVVASKKESASLKSSSSNSSPSSSPLPPSSSSSSPSPSSLGAFAAGGLLTPNKKRKSASMGERIKGSFALGKRQSANYKKDGSLDSQLIHHVQYQQEERREKERQKGKVSTYRVLILTKKGPRQIFIRSMASKTDRLKAIRVACATQGLFQGIQEMRFRQFKDEGVKEELLKLEDSFTETEHKFGVLYYKTGQSENEMFANLKGSPEYEEFLKILGQRITLKHWSQYSGGLDTNHDSTGIESLYTRFRDLEIMFHVSTMLPHFPDDEQQVERKRHLGNDIAVIVFMDGEGPYNPCIMKTKFNHIYAIVSVDKEAEAKKTKAEDNSSNDNDTNTAGETTTQPSDAGESIANDPTDKNSDTNDEDDNALPVRVEFASKEGVRPYGPEIPYPSPFRMNKSFVDFLLAKLVNGERAALQAPVFATKFNNTRKQLLEDLIQKYS